MKLRKEIPEHMPPHSFHIPVMGTGFTIDSPLKVARYGISAVVSLVDDFLVEQMRQFHATQQGMEFIPITEDDEDYRAHRITAYLNLLNKLVHKQVEELRQSDFGPGSDINRYFDLLPDGSLKDAYNRMQAETNPETRKTLQNELRKRIRPGSIDVNIMTKIDREVYRKGVKLPVEFNAAMASFRGFAKSDLRSSIVFSAGLNQRLYGYIPQFEDFFPQEQHEPIKKIILKVSDFRSALLQGKFLAKRGLWVSEYRIESGLNCGGHAFPTDGALMGPILQEFRYRKEELIANHFSVYNKALQTKGLEPVNNPFEVRVTVQGGIGTAEENDLLLEYYEVDSTGWGTPFLLVPEVTNVDQMHLDRLISAKENDVFLSNSSPFGIPFWNLRNSASEELRREEIIKGSPGSKCPKGYLKFNTEFTKTPICSASKTYQLLKAREIREGNYSEEQAAAMLQNTLAKACLCRDLSGGATLKNEIDPGSTPAVCPGPNIRYFNRVMTLDEMVEHIYGRLSLLGNSERPHMFIQEARLYIDYLKSELDKYSLRLSHQTPKYFKEFRENLVAGLDYYRGLADRFLEEKKASFLRDLKTLQEQIDRMPMLAAIEIDESQPVLV